MIFTPGIWWSPISVDYLWTLKYFHIPLKTTANKNIHLVWIHIHTQTHKHTHIYSIYLSFSHTYTHALSLSLSLLMIPSHAHFHTSWLAPQTHFKYKKNHCGCIFSWWFILILISKTCHFLFSKIIPIIFGPACRYSVSNHSFWLSIEYKWRIPIGC